MNNLFVSVNFGAYFWEKKYIPPILYEYALHRKSKREGVVYHGNNCWIFVDLKEDIPDVEPSNEILILSSTSADQLSLQEQIFLPPLNTNKFDPQKLLGFLKNSFESFIMTVIDRSKQILYLIVDPLGRRNIYYREINGGILWGTNIDFLRFLNDIPEISPEGINLYMGLKGVPAPYTLFRDVYKIPPGNYLEIKASSCRIVKYWNIEPDFTQNISADRATSYLRKAIDKGIDSLIIRNKINKLGVFLSGGLDSTILASLARKKISTHAFVVGYTDRTYTDESWYAQKVSEYLKIPISSKYISGKDVEELLLDSIYQLPEPVADIAFIPHLHLAKEAVPITNIILDGTGADAVFGGGEKILAYYYSDCFLGLPQTLKYTIRTLIKYLPSSRQWRLTRNIKKLKNFINGLEFDRDTDRLIFWTKLFDYKNLKQILDQDFRLNHDLSYSFLQNLLARQSFPDKQYKISKASYLSLSSVSACVEFIKLSSIEAISSVKISTPYLLPEIINFLLSLPDTYKVKGGISKIILRDSFSDILPPIVLRRKKTSFNPPINIWIRKELRVLFLDTLKRDIGIFNKKYLEIMLNQTELNWHDWSQELWAIFMLKLWLRNIRI